jgi:hypothetical protein
MCGCGTSSRARVLVGPGVGGHGAQDTAPTAPTFPEPPDIASALLVCRPEL